MSGVLETARQSWGHDIPDWVIKLAEACDASSQNKVAGRLGYTGAVISQVVRNKYAGNTDNVRDRVEGKLMGATVLCPALGNLPTNECQIWRQKARNFSGANHQRVMMFRACNRCPNNKQEGGK